MKLRVYLIAVAVGVVTVASAETARAQLRDTLEKISGNAINEGIHKNIGGQIGAGRGNNLTPGSSIYIIQRDPFRAIRRGRQIFQRKFLPTQGFGGRDGAATSPWSPPSAPASSIRAPAATAARGARPDHGGDVFTRPDSRDAPHLFGLGLQEMLGDEITTTCARSARTALAAAQSTGTSQTRTLTSKGISYGSITANADGTVETTQRGRRESRSARATVLRPGWHHLDPRVPGRGVQRRDGNSVR